MYVSGKCYYLSRAFSLGIQRLQGWFLGDFTIPVLVQYCSRNPRIHTYFISLPWTGISLIIPIFGYRDLCETSTMFYRRFQDLRFEIWEAVCTTRGATRTVLYSYSSTGIRAVKYSYSLGQYRMMPSLSISLPSPSKKKKKLPAVQYCTVASQLFNHCILVSRQD